jgi:Protein of unknown function (DUF2950)
MRMQSRTMSLGAVVSMLTLATVSTTGDVSAAGQKHFESADAAVSAVVEAARNGERADLIAIFGPDAERVLTSGDPVADREARAGFVARAAERTSLQRVGDDFAVLNVGNDDWPFAIPLIKETGGWIFDTRAGEEEVKTRRVGRNELYTIQIMQEYVGAQRDYARIKRATAGVAEYAQRLRSTPGERDGLYWDVQPGDNPSPIGPLFASASREGYRPGTSATPEPFHGYLYKLLTAAGPDAPGGARSYLKDGHLTGGFALLAYPVRYGSSGVMTFQVNNQGVVFQKDLGPRTAEVAARINAYDPDDSWDPTE